ncbi:MAG TPA: hypothetical protein VFV13_13110 [Acidimicrobiia bacterium]|nr:hypothetical protein [Acidimicrobiia bacterium]
MRPMRVLSLLLVSTLFACSSGTQTTTTAVPAALGEMPEVCIDALAEYLRLIEPVVEGIDFENLTGSDLETLGSELEGLSEDMTAEIEGMDCPDPVGSDDEAFNAVIALAEREAPGTVGYLEWVAAAVSGLEGPGEVSGDCETDIGALQGIIDQGGTMSELTMTQVVEVGSLVASISTACSPARAQEFFEREDVAEFLEER